VHWKERAPIDLSDKELEADRVIRERGPTTISFYIPGNHDEEAKRYIGGVLRDAIAIVKDAFHNLLDGRWMLVVHGDQFDRFTPQEGLLYHVGAKVYHAGVWVSYLLNRIGHRLGQPYIPVLAWAKRRSKDSNRYLANFDQELVQEAKRRRADAVLAGHVHTLSRKEIDGILVLINGAFMEGGGFDFWVENWDGSLEPVSWIRHHWRERRIHGSGRGSKMFPFSGFSLRRAALIALKMLASLITRTNGSSTRPPAAAQPDTRMARAA